MIRSFWKAGAPACALFCTIAISIKRVIIRIGSIGIIIIINDTVISSSPNWSVCFVLRRTCFLLIDVIIYVTGICGYTKRSLIKSRFSWCIIYTTFISSLSTLVTMIFLHPKDAQNIILLKLWRHEWRFSYMCDISNKSSLHYASNEV